MSPVPAPETDTVLFDRIVVGIDGSPEAVEAGRQASRLAPGRPMRLVSAVDTLSRPARPAEMPTLAQLMRDEAVAALDEAATSLRALPGVGPVETVPAEGRPADVLRDATGGGTGALVAVGTRGEGIPGAPPAGGSRYRERVVLQIVREMPCSVLVARNAPDPASFPRAISVGVDGSSVSAAAHAVAVRVAAVAGAELRCVIALGGKGADLDEVASRLPGVPLSSVDRRHPLEALLAAAERSDLVVVGHRGLHGLRALGSVSERFLAAAPSSVLVVRRT